MRRLGPAAVFLALAVPVLAGEEAPPPASRRAGPFPLRVEIDERPGVRRQRVPASAGPRLRDHSRATRRPAAPSASGARRTRKR